MVPDVERRVRAMISKGWDCLLIQPVFLLGGSYSAGSEFSVTENDVLKFEEQCHLYPRRVTHAYNR